MTSPHNEVAGFWKILSFQPVASVISLTVAENGIYFGFYYYTGAGFKCFRQSAFYSSFQIKVTPSG